MTKKLQLLSFTTVKENIVIPVLMRYVLSSCFEIVLCFGKKNFREKEVWLHNMHFPHFQFVLLLSSWSSICKKFQLFGSFSSKWLLVGWWLITPQLLSSLTSPPPGYFTKNFNLIRNSNTEIYGSYMLYSYPTSILKECCCGNIFCFVIKFFDDEWAWSSA